MAIVRHRLLSSEKHQELAKGITVELVMTPWQSVTRVAPTDLVRDALQLMENKKFNQLAVEVGDRCGLLRDSALRAAVPQAVVGDMVEWSTGMVELTTSTELMSALARLSDVPSTLVYAGDRIAGLVHRSDFNKQAVRSYLYLWFSALEMGLAELVRRRFSDENVWLSRLSKKTQAWVLGSVELARRDGVDLPAVEYVDLSDLMGIITSSQKTLGVPLWGHLGFANKSKWDNVSGSLIDLRHSIMHPVRTLIQDAASAERLVEQDRQVRELVAAVRTALDEDLAELEMIAARKDEPAEPLESVKERLAEKWGRLRRKQ